MAASESDVWSMAAGFSIFEATLMRKSMRAICAGALLAGFSLGIAGCTPESAVKEETKVTTPGGTARETFKIEKRGENPPSAPSERGRP
jgi:hypothetical protein